VARLQDGTGKHRRLVPADPIDNRSMHSLQPWLAIGVRQRMAVSHLLEIRCRMEIIAVRKLPAQFVRQSTADRRLPPLPIRPSPE
jgi:hypothetical protein